MAEGHLIIDLRIGERNRIDKFTKYLDFDESNGRARAKIRYAGR